MAGCGGARTVSMAPAEHAWCGRFQAMGSPCEVLCDTRDREQAERLAQIVADEAWRIESAFSRYVPGNVIDRINRANGATIQVDEEAARLIDFAATLFELSEGRFDVTSGVLREVWTFDGSDRVPGNADVQRVLERVGWQRVRWRNPHLTMAPRMEIDLGGLGKEYAVDRCAALVRAGADVAVLVNLGGDLVATAPPAGRGAWQVGVEGPAEDAAERLIELRQGALATSGDARRFLLRDGVRYGHILDPQTGWPVRDAPRSVTVAAETCTQAGMLSTFAMLKGRGAERFLETQGVRFWCRR